MAVATSTSELSALTERLAREYDLPLLPKGSISIKHLTNPGLGTKAHSQAEARAIVKVLNDLQPGTYFLITHPSLDESEVRSLRVKENIGAQRLGDVRQILTNPEAMQVIQRRGIELLGPEQAVRVLHHKESIAEELKR
jgi:hypothetical protein